MAPTAFFKGKIMANANLNHENKFLTDSLFTVFVQTAMPIILIMVINGLYTLVDAYFLGAFVGPDALTAVTLMFPLYMMFVALSTLVSNGYSSVVARLLGGRHGGEAGKSFAQAISLSLIVCGVLIVLFLLGGKELSLAAAKGSVNLSAMGYRYISIIIFFSPLMFILAINIDTLRCEGKMTMMAAISLVATLLNIVFNYILIVVLEFGVAGSAAGTICAQFCSLIAIIMYRAYGNSEIKFKIINLFKGRNYWSSFLALGAPTCLNYVGISLTSAVILYCLQLWVSGNYDSIVGAYGIVTRIMTFIFLPLLGMSMAFQTIIGHNFGAQLPRRVNSTIRLILLISFIYCAFIQFGSYIFRDTIGYAFVNDPKTVFEIARILPISTMVLFIFGPLMMIRTYFQAIGDAKRAALLTLTRTYIFGVPLTLILPYFTGEWGIWYAGPVAEILLLILTLGVLYLRSSQSEYRFGLFYRVTDI